ncbi:MAG: amidohydrolase family protein, partial [Kiritimatiellae bacterium]|nr:amidohydrolase family protein [Kiritimatiellia bacterium]
PAPYAAENELLLREVYDFCPELTARFLPFVSVDPLRRVAAQCSSLEALSSRYPIYGIKVSGVLCQAPLTAFLKQGRPLLDLARERNWPILFHTTCSMDDCYSNSELAFRVIEARPDLRFALAHAIGFQQQALDRARQLPNVWIDSAALTIQVKLARDNSNIVAPREQRFRADYRHPGKVLSKLATAYPGRMLWGSDTPAYSYICRRRQGGDTIQEFRLKAVYEDEVAALRYLPEAQQREVANRNTLDFVFGS